MCAVAGGEMKINRLFFFFKMVDICIPVEKIQQKGENENWMMLEREGGTI